MITNDPEDIDYFKLVQEDMKPKGSTIPHPVDWKGKEGAVSKAYGPRVSALNEVEPLDYEHKFRTEDGRRRKLTEKQKRMAQFMLQGYTKRQAMLKAGYSKNVADKSMLSNQKTILAFFEGVRGRFSRLGVDEGFVAEKMREWMTANKTLLTKHGEKEVPDYKTQIEGYDRFAKLIEPKEMVVGKKREIKLTEWIKDEEEEVIEEP